jgi:hypothetical protein
LEKPSQFGRGQPRNLRVVTETLTVAIIASSGFGASLERPERSGAAYPTPKAATTLPFSEMLGAKKVSHELILRMGILPILDLPEKFRYDSSRFGETLDPVINVNNSKG